MTPQLRAFLSDIIFHEKGNGDGNSSCYKSLLSQISTKTANCDKKNSIYYMFLDVISSERHCHFIRRPYIIVNKSNKVLDIKERFKFIRKFIVLFVSQLEFEGSLIYWESWVRNVITSLTRIVVLFINHSNHTKNNWWHQKMNTIIEYQPLLPTLETKKAFFILMIRTERFVAR